MSSSVLYCAARKLLALDGDKCHDVVEIKSAARVGRNSGWCSTPLWKASRAQLRSVRVDGNSDVATANLPSGTGVGRIPNQLAVGVVLAEASGTCLCPNKLEPNS